MKGSVKYTTSDQCMKIEALKNFNLPFNQSDEYWICIVVVQNTRLSALESTLLAAGMSRIKDSLPTYIIRSPKAWNENWKVLRGIIDSVDALGDIEVAVVSYTEKPQSEEMHLNRKAVQVIDAVAENLWLGSAMMEDRVRCHMQPVMDKRGKIFGYEAFARILTPDGSFLSGGKIFSASRHLNVEHLLDRLLHIEAVKTFIQSDLEGFLFVNFVPGFIHRPEKYLEGLTEAAKIYNMQAKHVVLDFTRAETPRDALHLRGIFDYCRSKGYSVSLDDINSVAMATRLIDVIRPDFIKLDMGLVRSVTKPIEHAIIRDLVELAHANGCQVIGEGVETEEVHEKLKDVGVDLFQGYLFAAPSAASARKEVG